MWPQPAKSLRTPHRFERNEPCPGTEGREKTMPAYDPDNIFAKILRGELP